MDLSPYIERLRRELAVAAEAGGEDSRELAERLTMSLESAARLALLEALSAAADEITRDLAPGSVDVRLRGRDPAFVVTPAPPSHFFEEASSPTTSAPPSPVDADEGGTSRISLRVPDHLKSRIEEASGREGLSLNAWLVRAVSAALDLASRPARSETTSSGGRRFTGWVR